MAARLNDRFAIAWSAIVAAGNWRWKQRRASFDFSHNWRGIRLGYARRYWLLVIALVAFAAAIELAQLLVPGRHARFTDFLTDGAAASLGIGFSYLLEKLERIAFRFLGRVPS